MTLAAARLAGQTKEPTTRHAWALFFAHNGMLPFVMPVSALPPLRHARASGHPQILSCANDSRLDSLDRGNDERPRRAAHRSRTFRQCGGSQRSALTRAFRKDQSTVDRWTQSAEFSTPFPAPLFDLLLTLDRAGHLGIHSKYTSLWM